MRLRRQNDIIAGRVSAAGVPTAGRDFTVINIATGQYQVNLAPGFRMSAVTVSLIAGFGAGVTANVGSVTDRTFAVNIATSAGAGVAQAFSFVAVSA